MALARAYDRREYVEEGRGEAAVETALAALVPAGEAGPPAWPDVVRRAAVLPVCTCRARGEDDA